jgi:hypothetical protein
MIKLEHVYKSFDQGKSFAVQDITLEVDQPSDRTHKRTN